MSFTKVCSSSLDGIIEFFDRYVDCSGQVCNPTKSIIFAGSMSAVRHDLLANKIGFQMGILPLVYLGVPIFKGRPKASYFQPVADPIKNKLVSWKASLLSIAGRV